MEIVDEANCSMCQSNPDGEQGPIPLNPESTVRLCTSCYGKWMAVRETPQLQN